MTEWERLRTAILDNLTLRDRLLAETEDHRFVEMVAAVAAENGFAVGLADVRKSLEAARLSWIARQTR